MLGEVEMIGLALMAAALVYELPKTFPVPLQVTAVACDQKRSADLLVERYQRGAYSDELVMGTPGCRVQMYRQKVELSLISPLAAFASPSGDEFAYYRAITTGDSYRMVYVIIPMIIDPD